MATEVASAVVSLMPSFRGGKAAISKELAGVTGQASTAAGAAGGKKFGSAFLAPLKGIAGPLAAVFAGTAIVDFLSDAVAGASDLQETVSKTRVVFGPAADAVLRFTKAANTGLGQTQQQALDAAATFGVFGKSAGLQGKALSDFSTEMVTLAADMASFSNTTPDQAIQALGAALRGESEPIRAYGVLLDDASLRQEAVRQGIAKTTKEALTPQQKVLAAHGLILKQTADAQGDFARTSGGLANQQRILSAQWTDLKTNLGTALLPVITQVVTAFNDFLPSLMKVGKGVGSTLGPVFKRVTPLVKSFINGLTGGKAGGSGPFAEATKAGGKFRQVIGAIAGVFRAVAPIVGTVLGFIGKLAPVFGTIVGAVGGFVSALLPDLQKLAGQITAVLGPGLDQIAGILKTTVAPAFTALLTALRPVASFLIGVVGGAVVGALKGAVQAIGGALKIIGGIFNVFAGIFSGDWSRVWSGVKQIATGVWDAIKGLFKVFINVGIGKAFSLAGRGILAVGRKLWGGLKSLFTKGILQVAFVVGSGIGKVLRFFKDLPGKAFRALGRLGKGLVDIHVRAFNDARRAVSTGISRLLGLVREIPGRVRRGLGNVGTVLKDAGRRMIQGLIDGLKSMLGSVRGAASDVMQAVKDFLPGSPAKRGPLSGRGWSKYAGQHLVEDLTAGIAQRSGGAQKALAGALTIPRPTLGVAGAGGTALGGGDTYVTVLLDEKPIRAVVRTEVDEAHRGIRRAVTAGVGAGR